MAQTTPWRLNVFDNFDRWAWYAFALAFAVTTSTALTSILSGGVLLWTFSHHREWWNAIKARKDHPVLRAILVFFAILLLGAFIALAHGYSPWEILGKHTRFVLLLCLVGMLNTPERRRGIFLGFAFGMLLAMVLSIASATFGIQIHNAVPGGDFAPFLNHTEHNIFLSLVVFGLVSLLVAAKTSGKLAWIGWAISLVAFVDIMFFVQGRTGQAIFVILAMLLLVTLPRSGKTKVLLAGLLAAVVGAVAIFGHSALNHGIEAVHSDLNAYHQGNDETSVGLRLQFAKSALSLIRDGHPILGGGTGSFRQAYADYYQSHRELQPPFHNPHDDYLFYWAENGLPGLIGLIGLYVTMLVFAARTGGLPGLWMTGLTLAWCIPSAANSVMLDQTSGFAFVILLSAFIAGTFPFMTKSAGQAAAS